MSTKSTQSAAREAETTNTSDGKETSTGTALTACESINSEDMWIDLEVKVLELWESTSKSVSQVGLLGDSSGSVTFVSWATSNLPKLEEGASYALQTVVIHEYDGSYSVNLNSATEIEEITGSAAERERLAVVARKPVKLDTIDTADQWVDVCVKVDQLWDPNSDSIAQVGLLGDETGRIKFTAWAVSDLEELEVGERYELSKVVTDEYEGRYSVKLNSKTTIEHFDGEFAAER